MRALFGRLSAGYIERQHFGLLLVEPEGAAEFVVRLNQVWAALDLSSGRPGGWSRSPLDSIEAKVLQRVWVGN